jgi:transposase-like protein
MTKIKTAYPSDEALRKIIFLATADVAKKWTMPLRKKLDRLYFAANNLF